MASKQLGKLRQWAGEVISTRDKAIVSDEFRELEKDIALRKEGVERLYASSEAYKASLARKKDSEALDDAEKLLPIDALGIVMIIHGEEFGHDSAFGTSLVKLGRAHCKIATLQEAYALTFEATFMASTKRFGDDIKDYELQRKKLESRRLSYDAAISKLEKVKSSKKEKEKDRREAEDELQKARLRYEETSEDVRARIRAIQENEIHQLRELNSFLDVELNFMEQYVEVLKDVKEDWCDESQIAKFEARKLDGPSHIFSRPAPKFSSVRSRRSTSRGPNKPNAGASLDASDEEGPSHPRLSRRPSTTRIPDLTSTFSSRPQSRPDSRASRKRSDSAATTGEGTDKEKEKAEKGRSLNVAGWASSAVGSVTGRGKRNKDKDKFAALKDEGDGDSDGEDVVLTRPPSSVSLPSRRLSRSKSKENNGESPKVPPRLLKPTSLQDKKLVRALYDFTGSVDELSFRAGAEIVVVNKVLDEWWMGELDGRKGLFPTSYTEAISPKRRRIGIRNTDSDMASSLSSEDADGNKQDGPESDLENDHIYTAHHLTTPHSLRSPFSVQSDSASITSSVAEEEEKRALMPIKTDPDLDYYPPRTQMLHSLSSPTLLTSSRSAIDTSTGKKVPPPPPPRRLTNNPLVNSPAIPERKQKDMRSHSSGSLPQPNLNLTRGLSISNREYDTSPFESSTEIPRIECLNFKQNPFKPRGMCSNCFELHE